VNTSEINEGTKAIMESVQINHDRINGFHTKNGSRRFALAGIAAGNRSSSWLGDGWDLELVCPEYRVLDVESVIRLRTSPTRQSWILTATITLTPQITISSISRIMIGEYDWSKVLTRKRRRPESLNA
jgi:hypothetical protein